jgi:hypothetical protein
MRPLCVLVFVLSFLSGCMTPEENQGWMREAMKDWTGERMMLTGETTTPYSPKPAGMR